jgi:nucleoside-diphosphate-sugar epimerase
MVAPLRACGWQVRVPDNVSTSRCAELPAPAQTLQIPSGEIRDGRTVELARAKVEAVLKHAAPVSVAHEFDTPALAKDIQGPGTGGFFTAAARVGARRLTFSSSCGVYGSSAAGGQRGSFQFSSQSPDAATNLAGDNLTADATPVRSDGCRRYSRVGGLKQSAKSDNAAVIRFIDAARHTARAPNTGMASRRRISV